MALDQVLRGKVNDEARKAVVDHVGPAIEAQMDSIKKAVLEAVSAKDATQGTSKGSLPWILTTASMFLVVAVLLSGLWFRVLRMEDQNQAQLQYDRELAHWLVTSGRSQYQHTEAMDLMIRRVAKVVGADVSDIALPQYLEPPNNVQRYHLEFE